MPPRPRRLLLAPACALMWLAACSVLPTPTSQPAEPTARPVPSPAFSIPVDVSVREGPGAGEWTVLGLARTGTEALTDPRLLFVLLDRAGAEIERRTIEIPIDHLPRDTAWPIRAVFQPSSKPESATARLQGDPTTALPAAEAAAEVLGTFIDDQGRVMALGRLKSVGDGPVEILGLRLLGWSEDGAITEVVEAESALSIVSEGTPAPFFARLTETEEGISWEAFPLVRPADRDLPEVSVDAVEVFTDDQGNPFVTARVVNTSDSPVTIRATGVLREGAAWLAGRTVEIPMPTLPGETALVTIRVPATALNRGADPEGVEWDLFLDAREAAAGSITIPGEVVGYEPAGSTLVLRVRVSGPPDTPLERSAVAATLRSEAGQVVSGAWSDVSALGPGEETVVILSLALPRGFDLTASILDVTATGTPGAP